MPAGGHGVSSPSIRSQLVGAAGGIVLLMVLLFVGATYRLVVLPAQDEIAANDMRLASAKAVDRVGGMVRGVEQVTRSAREWGLKGLFHVEAPEQFIQLIQPVIGSRPEITAVLLA